MRIIHLVGVIAALMVLCGCLVGSVSLAQVPGSMHIQGQLTDLSGNPVPPGDKTFTFRIFNAPVGGAKVWPGGAGEVQILTIPPSGSWDAQIGAVMPLSAGVFADSARWLEIVIDDGVNPSDILPRLKLAAAPYAFRAAMAQRADTATVLAGGAAFLPLAGGKMAGPITSTGNPSITMGKGNFGSGNTNKGAHAFVAGENNEASGDRSSVAGGVGSVVDGDTATCGGGAFNTVSGEGATVAGGIYNKARGAFSVVGGGGGRAVDSNAAIGDWTVVAGGRQNRAGQLYVDYATVSGGAGNEARGEWSAVGGGSTNTALGQSATIAGGGNNSADGHSAAVGGGAANHADGDYAVVGGGAGNEASGDYAVVAGGRYNTASASNSFAAGYRAKAVHTGSFVWGDAQSADVSSDQLNQFKIRALNGVHLASEATDAKAVGFGELYSDNSIVAWGKVAGASGTLSGNEFNVNTVTRDSAGAYTVLIFASAESAAELIPVVTVEVESIPRSAGTARHWYVNQVSANSFEVYITNGNYGSIDNDFVFIVTGRD